MHFHSYILVHAHKDDGTKVQLVVRRTSLRRRLFKHAHGGPPCVSVSPFDHTHLGMINRTYTHKPDSKQPPRDRNYINYNEASNNHTKSQTPPKSPVLTLYPLEDVATYLFRSRPEFQLCPVNHPRYIYHQH